jgi:hypothetical protein
MTKPTGPARQCTARRSNGQPCRGRAMIGLGVCYQHGGASPGGQRKHLVAKQLTRFGLGDALDDPVETLLRQITQTRQRCDLYASLLERQYVEAEAEQAPDIRVDDGEPTDYEDGDGHATYQTLQGPRIPKWVAGLIGFKYAAAGKDGYMYASDEGVRALVQLEQSERKILTDQCKAAISAGIAEKQVQLAQQQGALVVAAVRMMVDMAIAQGMPAEHAAIILQVAPGALRAIEGQTV